MKHFFSLILIAVALAAFVPSAQAQKKQEQRTEYVIKELKLKKDKAAQARPVILAYFKEMKEAKSLYNDIKDKYKSAIKNGQLTNAQADQLMKAHWESNRKQQQVKEKYEPLFKKILTSKQTFMLYDYANDNLKKKSEDE